MGRVTNTQESFEEGLERLIPPTGARVQQDTDIGEALATLTGLYQAGQLPEAVATLLRTAADIARQLQSPTVATPGGNADIGEGPSSTLQEQAPQSEPSPCGIQVAYRKIEELRAFQSDVAKRLKEVRDIQYEANAWFGNIALANMVDQSGKIKCGPAFPEACDPVCALFSRSNFLRNAGKIPSLRSLTVQSMKVTCGLDGVEIPASEILNYKDVVFGSGGEDRLGAVAQPGATLYVHRLDWVPAHATPRTFHEKISTATVKGELRNQGFEDKLWQQAVKVLVSNARACGWVVYSYSQPQNDYERPSPSESISNDVEEIHFAGQNAERSKLYGLLELWQDALREASDKLSRPSLLPWSSSSPRAEMTDANMNCVLDIFANRHHVRSVLDSLDVAERQRNGKFGITHKAADWLITAATYLEDLAQGKCCHRPFESSLTNGEYGDSPDYFKTFCNALSQFPTYASTGQDDWGPRATATLFALEQGLAEYANRHKA